MKFIKFRKGKTYHIYLDTVAYRRTAICGASRQSCIFGDFPGDSLCPKCKAMMLSRAEGQIEHQRENS